MAGRVLLEIVYLLVRRVLSFAVLVLHRDLIKDAELLALLYENTVLLRRSSGHRTSRPTGCGPRRWRSWPGSFRAFEADLDGLFFAFTMANLAGRILAYACGSKAQAVALMDNLINGLARERARAAA